MDKLVIGLMGIKGSGKSEVAKILAEDHGFAILEPGMQVMELLLDINPTIVTEADGAVSVRYLYEEHGYLGFKGFAEGRRLLQALGTDAMRARDPYFWVTQQMRAIESTDGNIVHTSVRFPNEAQLIHGWEGQLWEVIRDVPDEQEHVSELAWRDLVPDREVDNNGTLSDLRETVRNLLT